MDIIQKLNEIGLGEKESKVYVALLELRDAAVQDIAKKAKINRSTTYIILNRLREQGLIKETRKGAKRLFVATSPDKLSILLEQKERALRMVMPHLQAINNKATVKPSVEFYEGEDGFMTALKDYLTAQNNEVLIFASDAVLGTINEIAPEIIEQRIEKKILAKILAPASELFKQNLSEDAKWLRKTKFIPDKYVFDLGIYIYNDKVNLLSIKDKIGLIIQSKDVSDAWRKIFNLIWDLT